MNTNELTDRTWLATFALARGIPCEWPRPGWRRRLALVMGGAVALSACVSVNAPDKPIVIELNINIKQEVVYRLAADAAQTVDSNPEVF